MAVEGGKRIVMKPRSIRFSVISWYAAILGGAFILFGLAIYFGVEGVLEKNLWDMLEKRAQQIGETLVGQIPTRGEAFVADAIKARYAPETYERLIRVTRADGREVYASGKGQIIDPGAIPPLRAMANTYTADAIRLPDDGRVLVVASRFKAGADWFTVEVGELARPIETSLRQLRLSLVLGVPVVLLVAVAGGWFVVGRSLAPVTHMAASADRITLERSGERLPVVPTGDELEHLARSLNHMVHRLHEAFEQNQRFIADASHELRTPLAVLRGELETVLQNAVTIDTRERAGSALEEVDRLTKIVEQLFAIARLDAGEAQSEMARVDLANLTFTTAEQMALLAEDKEIIVSCDVSPPVWVQGDRARLKQVIVNLLDNAIKYTGAGGAVSLSVVERNNQAILEVSDSGIGIPSEALPHVFERFYRVDKARSRGMGGAGLGLAIVKSICAAHGGQVRVQSTEGRGSRFIVFLPLATRTTTGAPLNEIPHPAQM